MKKLFVMLFLSVCLTFNVFAGEREWATAGKILTGVVVADVLFNHVPQRQHHNHYENRHVYYYTPPVQPVVYYNNPQPIFVKPNPTIIVENKQVWIPTGTVNEIKYTNSFYDSYGKFHPATQYVERKEVGYYKTIQEVRTIPFDYSYGN